MPLGSGPSRSDKASKAHLELATATKDSVFGPILGNTVTPPALSPSPSISGDHSYVAVSTGSQSRANQTQRGRVFPSPRREYMDIALNGLTGESPSAMATPSSRTLLGTERYRDTRFGDEPFVAWSLPSVDYDSANL
jgi:hypothetical protein